jgi:hypothetical protein
MRTRRHFQPILDSMPSRIAPSAICGVAPVQAAELALTNTPVVQIAAQFCDTPMPETGSSTPNPPK